MRAASRLSLLVSVILFNANLGFAQINREAPFYSPTIDGQVTADEMANQLVVPMVWPIDEGALLLQGSGFSEEEISGTWYVSWDETNLNLAAVVLDNTPDYRLPAGGAFNAQDVIQPVFNPFNDPDHLFVDGIDALDEVVDEVAAIYDFVVNTADEDGPDVFRHGHFLDDDEYESILIAGSERDDELGYTIEVALPWATAMDDVMPDYVPASGDIHGLSFILLSFNGEDGGTADIATLFTDFGEGANTIGDPLSWNTITLVGTPGPTGDFDANGVLEAADLDALAVEINGGGENLVFDVNGDGSVDVLDHSSWVKDLKKTWIGDSNLDGEFNSTDFVAVFQAGEYEDAAVRNSTWATGDWNGDQEFNSSDFVAAFQDGGFELGPVAAQSVPEPSGFAIVTVCLIGLVFVRKNRG